ncbi:MAG: hypothetical protein JEZ07_15985 [Phycisphaerae bacterium]|nr:hypothetical protein [Phycisphaerae bacterium]
MLDTYLSMKYSKLKMIANELLEDEIAVIMSLTDEPCEIEIIAKEVNLSTVRVREILIKFHQQGIVDKFWD